MTVSLLILLLFVVPSCSFLGSRGSGGFRLAGLTKNRFHSLAMNSVVSKRYIPPSFELRVENEEVTAYELEKLFSPDRFELLDINSRNSKGFAGLLFSLEGALVNIEAIYTLAFHALARQVGATEPPPSRIAEVIGLTFRDAVTQLNLFPLDLDHIEMKALEVQFMEMMRVHIEQVEIEPFPDAVDVLDAALSDNNGVSIITSLPRDLAQLILNKADLGLLLEGRVDSRNLISIPSLDDLQEELDEVQEDLHDLENSINRFAQRRDFINAFHPTYGDRYYQNHLLKGCGRLYKAPMLAVYIDRSHTLIQSAKKCGMSTIALRGNAQDMRVMRGADFVVEDLSAVHMNDVYDIVRRAVKNAQGPAQQQVAALQKPTPTRLLSVETPLLDRDRTDHDPSGSLPLRSTFKEDNDFDMSLISTSRDTFPSFSTQLSSSSEGMDEDEFRWLDSSPAVNFEDEEQSFA